MTEQEYMDVTDLQLFRAAKQCLMLVNAFDAPNKSRSLSIMANLDLCIHHQEKVIEELEEGA